MKTATPTDEEIALALIEGIQLAIPKGGNEYDVITSTTPEMLAAFMRWAGIAEKKSEKLAKLGIAMRAYCASRVVVVTRPGMWAASRAMRRPKK